MGHRATAGTKGRKERFAAQLEVYLTKNKLSCAALAAKLGLPLKSVQNWSNGVMPRRETYNQIVRTLGLNRGFIEGYEITSKPKLKGTFTDYVAHYPEIRQHHKDDLPLFLSGLGLRLFHRIFEAGIVGTYIVDPCAGFYMVFECGIAGTVKLDIRAPGDGVFFHMALENIDPRLDIREDIACGAITEESVREIIKQLDKLKQIGQRMKDSPEWKPDMSSKADEFLARRGN